MECLERDREIILVQEIIGIYFMHDCCYSYILLNGTLYARVLALCILGPTDPNRSFRLLRWEVAVFNREIFKLQVDLDMLYQIADRLSNEHIGYQAMFAANEMVTEIKRGNHEYASI
jgi:hypothetical protein